MIKKYENFCFFILCLFPISLFSGNLIFETIIIFLGLNFIFFFKKINFEYFNKNLILILFLIFFILIFLSFFSADKLISFKKSISLVRFIFFSLFASYLLSQNPNRIKIFFNFFLVGFLFVLVDALVQIFFGTSLMGNRNTNILFIGKPFGYEISGIFFDEQILGSYISRNIPILLTLLIIVRGLNPKNLITSLVFLILSILIVLFTSERLALIYILLFSFIFILSLNISLKYKTLVFGIIIGFVFLIIFVHKPIYKRLVHTTLKEMSFANFKETKKIIIFSERHNAHYIVASKLFLNRPFLGYGPNTFHISCSMDGLSKYNGCSTHPHNVFLQVASETGLVGLTVYFYIFFIILIKLIKYLKKNIINYENLISLDYKNIFLLSVILIQISPFLPSGNLFNNWILANIFFSITFLNINKIYEN